PSVRGSPEVREGPVGDGDRRESQSALLSPAGTDIWQSLDQLHTFRWHLSRDLSQTDPLPTGSTPGSRTGVRPQGQGDRAVRCQRRLLPPKSPQSSVMPRREL